MISLQMKISQITTSKQAEDFLSELFDMQKENLISKRTFMILMGKYTRHILTLGDADEFVYTGVDFGHMVRFMGINTVPSVN